MWEDLYKQMSITNEKQFVIGKKESFTYGQLRGCCAYFNDLYIRLGVKRVLLSVGQEFLSYSAILAAYMTGSTFCVINPDLPLERKKYMAEQYRPDLILCGSRDELMDYTGTTVMSVNRAKEEAAAFTGTEIRKAFDEKVMYISFTSGTTGLPKGCMIKRTGFETFCKWASGAFEFSSADRCGQYVPLYFDMSLVDVFGGVLHGVTLIPFPTITEKLRPGTVVQKYGINFMNVTPQFLELLQRTNQFSHEYLKTLRMIRFGGDKIHRAVLERLFEEMPELKVVSTYGPTETTCFAFHRIVTKADYAQHTTDIVSIGNPNPGWNAYLADMEDGVGEIVIYGPHIGFGYLNAAGNNSYRREIINGVEEETYHTGDYARIENGEYFFEGRKDAQIKINGNRISLNEVEFALLETGAREAAAVYVQENIFGFYSEDGANTVSENERKLMLQDRLPRYAVPSLCLKVKELPLNPNGKIDRKKLRDQAIEIMRERRAM